MPNSIPSANQGQPTPSMPRTFFVRNFLFGAVDFGESEEYQAFQFQLLAVAMFLGAVFTLFFVVGAYTHLNPINNPHRHSMGVFTAVTLVLWLLLRGHKERYLPITWSYLVLCLLEYTSALVFVPEDELRILWLFTNVPGVYLLLGQRVGLATSMLVMLALAAGNPHLARPYSPNAMATALVSLTYLTVFFHVYGSRSISYFLRMREANDRLQQLASHDMLTGVLNARAYYQRCDALISLAQREQSTYAVLFIDLDHFKSINDTHGHGIGDLVLKSVADCLATSVRQSDVVGRIGGEEFSLFLPHTDRNGAHQLAEFIRSAIEALAPGNSALQLKVTASIGVAHSDLQHLTMQAIQQRADSAMYLAKASGRNRVSHFDDVADAQPAG